ncbi:hypothetical protein EDB84DRAFT_1443905 [Lactarius hengduanensis]|nr:hypothetical protein EDB84DRAFT_1443905 [Lactarius hengduanensis]
MGEASMGHGAVSLRRVGVVGVDGPRHGVGVEVPQHRVVTMRRCRRATTPCRYGTWCQWATAPHRASVSKGHGAVLLRRVGVVGVDGPRRCVVTARRCRRAMAPCCYAAWVSSVSMGHDAMSLRRVGVEGPWRRVVMPRRCRRCRWATTPCRYGASVSMGHGAAWVSKGHNAAWVSKGRDAA